jgi:ubiquinone/menaquinone biosynthesis C-methylase UbiE
MIPKKRSDYEAIKIIEMTEPDKKSVFLDIGSGTGDLTHALQSKGFKVFGIDKSPAMIQHANEKHSDLQIKHGDVTDPMAYESNTFTHILCMGMTIYEFNNKPEILENCYFWLKSGGYLIINVVDPDKFDTIIPGGKPALLSNPQSYAENRIKDTIIDFIDFEYKASYDFKNDKVVLKETFTDGLTKNVRQNEFSLTMENKETILNMAVKTGFLVKGFSTMKDATGDDHQYIYILERPN